MSLREKMHAMTDSGGTLAEEPRNRLKASPRRRT